MTNLESILRSRDITANKGLYSQSYAFLSSHVWMWELNCKESWVPKNWCFQVVVLQKTLESPWVARRSKQSILKAVNPEYSLERLMLKPKLHYFGHLMQRANLLEKTLMLEKIEGKRRKRRQDEVVGWNHWLNGHAFEQTTGDSKGKRILACCSSWGHRSKNELVTEQQW